MRKYLIYVFGFFTAIHPLIIVCHVNDSEINRNLFFNTDHEFSNDTNLGSADSCRDQTCSDRGTCVTDNNGRGFSCICYEGYEGNTCETVMVMKDACHNQTCNNGGLCVEDEDNEQGFLCICNEDYTGTTCEIIDSCRDQTCSDRGTCVTDNDGRGFFCICNEGYMGNTCEIVIGVNDACHNQTCNNRGTCVEDEDNEQGFLCICDDKYSGTTCEIVNCGKYCKFCYETAWGKKRCDCEIGYSFLEDLDSCENCMKYCDENSADCTFSSSRSATCICKDGYAFNSYTGSCEPCDCGSNGKCNIRFTKECECQEGYKEKNGQCQACSCGLNGNCYFDSNGEKKCQCQNRFIEIEGYCYENDSCQDENACPVTTVCVGTLTGYSCECKEGYEIKNQYSNPKYDGCKDINECNYIHACSGKGTMCINLEGGYSCVCKDGYRMTKVSIDPKNNVCEREPSDLITVAIVCGVVGVTAIVALMIAIIVKIRRDSNA